MPTPREREARTTDRPTLRGARRRDAGATSRSCRRGCSGPGCSSSTRWSPRPTSRSPTTTASPRRCGRAWRTGTTSSHDYPFFWPAMRNTLWFVVVIGHAAGRLRAGASACSSSSVKRGSSACFRTLFYAPYLAPPVAGDAGVRLPAQPRHRPGQHGPRQARPAPAGLVQRPRLVQAGADPAGAVGCRRPDGDLHGRAARRAPGALRGRRARRRRGRRRFRHVTLPTPAADPGLRRRSPA